MYVCIAVYTKCTYVHTSADIFLYTKTQTVTTIVGCVSSSTLIVYELEKRKRNTKIEQELRTAKVRRRRKGKQNGKTKYFLRISYTFLTATEQREQDLGK